MVGRRQIPALALVVALLVAGCGLVAPTPSPSPTPSPTLTPAPAPVPRAGPPYPQPLPGRVVYDYARLLSEPAEARLAELITEVMEVSGADVIVYTQFKPLADEASTERDAIALLHEWEVGLDEDGPGLVILINMTRVECIPGSPGNGQLQMYAGRDYRTRFLSDEERQQMFDEEMLPLLRDCDFDGALLLALERIAANAREVGPTPSPAP